MAITRAHWKRQVDKTGIDWSKATKAKMSITCPKVRQEYQAILEDVKRRIAWAKSMRMSGKKIKITLKRESKWVLGLMD